MHNVSYENEFDLQYNKPSKTYLQKACDNRTRLETEVKGNTEMAYSVALRPRFHVTSGLRCKCVSWT